MSDSRYCVDIAKQGRAGCKKCKQKIDKGTLRLGKMVANFFSDSGGDMKQWYHVDCMFEMLGKARATTKKIENPNELDGWSSIDNDSKKIILDKISAFSSKVSSPGKVVSKKSPAAAKNVKTTPTKSPQTAKTSDSPIATETHTSASQSEPNKDDSLRAFRKLLADIANHSAYTDKTRVVATFFKKGSDGNGFKGNLYMWVRLLLPGVIKRIYRLQSKQLVKLFSQLLKVNQDKMVDSLEQGGDVAETIAEFSEKTKAFKFSEKSLLSLQEVDLFLEELTTSGKEEDQTVMFKKILPKCTVNDLKVIIRIIMGDLRINSGAKHILDAIHEDAYDAFQNSRDLKAIIDKVRSNQDLKSKSNGASSSLDIGLTLMTPIKPALAEACKSVEFAFKRCPTGMYAEIKYDGERIQLHKQGAEFKFFSRSLKTVLPHKVDSIKEHIPKAFTRATDLILDAEVLMMDTTTGNPLPFGTLGKHKREAFKDACVCLFVFDCLYIDGQSLINKPFRDRRKLLEEQMVEVQHKVMFSQVKFVTKPAELSDMIHAVIQQGLEGLVLKDPEAVYEPGKRHWQKVKKDYLQDGAMADSVDLVVVGAYFGTGNKGGLMSSFLMACYDENRERWLTVSKVHGGHDDATLDLLQTQLKMKRIAKDIEKVPDWLEITKNMAPDFICQDPEKSQVWEITGAEFTKAEIHTADGISIRFPRVTKIRRDKTWKEATTFAELKTLYQNSNRQDATSHSMDAIFAKSPSKSTLESPLKPASKSPAKQASPSKITDYIPVTKGVVRSVPGNVKQGESKRKGSKKDESPAKRRKVETDEANETVDQPGTSTSWNKDILPDIFNTCRIYLDSNIDNWIRMKRYVIAYGGQLVSKSKANILVFTASSNPTKENGVKSGVVKVTSDWLMDSIKLQTKAPLRLYQIV